MEPSQLGSINEVLTLALNVNSRLHKREVALLLLIILILNGVKGFNITLV